MNLLLGLVGLFAAQLGDPQHVDDFACLDQAGRFQKLSRHADAALIVLYVFADDCPIVRQNAAELQTLAKDFAPRGVRFLGLDPAPHDDRASVAEETAELGLTLPVLLDDTQCVAEMLGLTRTAEALVVSTESWRVLWRGPLDDRLQYGAQRDAATRAYLREALEALLAKRAPPADVPPTKGCAITFLQPRTTHAVDYARDVAPILDRRCVSCHREGGIGPWSMDQHARVRGMGAMTREVLLERRMPPWNADPNHGSFVEDIGIQPDEARTLVHWIENGAPRGEGEDPLATARPPIAEWTLGEPDLVIELPEQVIPANGLVPYHHETVELDLPEERWVRALDLRPSNPTVLHHAFTFISGLQEVDTFKDESSDLPPKIREQAERWFAEHGDSPDDLPPEALDIIRKRAFQGRTYFARYFPGTRSTEQREGGKRPLADQFPAGTGKRLPAKAKLIFELHYTTTGTETTDRPKLALYFHDSPPPRELKVTSAFTRKISLAPGARDVHVQAERTFAHDAVVYALSPHMHYRGRSMRYTAFYPDGRSDVLLNVPEYVFDWQANYTLREPLHLPAGTRVVCDATYDNSPLNEYNPDPRLAVRFGPRSQDEMLIGYIVYARP